MESGLRSSSSRVCDHVQATWEDSHGNLELPWSRRAACSSDGLSVLGVVWIFLFIWLLYYGYNTLYCTWSIAASELDLIALGLDKF